MDGELLLVGLVVIGLIGRSRNVTTSACILLIIKLLSLDQLLPVIERRGLETGLMLLTIGVLVPFLSGKITKKDVASIFTSPPGILALAGGALATYTNGTGLQLLQAEPHLIAGLVIGSIFGIVFLKGVPAGPLMAAGIAAMLMMIKDFFFG
ncbi:DUF441 domain-containing protein [Paenibacillus antri]|uniref:UPF0756 membrane protein FE782_18790 n=1 Tax=Paenibacillus antri TaxID=2582848 RepID=A0A5R9GBJ7_9BACL|nr:DUF441 domain-containing protein [Paenibacillus antri]TLS50748.1 DUF441 domain-containing protein [Paenibacillus antri]